MCFKYLYTLRDSMKTGISDCSNLAKAHVNAVIAGALRVFCVHTYHDMLRLYALGIDDEPQVNFRAAAIKQIQDPDGVSKSLQDVVEQVIESPDGMPTFAEEYHEIVAQIMLDYNAAYRAAMQGDEAFKQYRQNTMMPQIEAAADLSDCDTEHENAMHFLFEIDQYEEQWQSFEPQRPLEKIIREIFPAR